MVFMLFFLGQELKQRLEIRQEVKQLEAQISNFEGKNQGLRELVDYFKTPEYRERQARSLLNLQKPGEFAVALPQLPEEEETTAPKPSLDLESNLRLWWNYFFGKK